VDSKPGEGTSVTLRLPIFSPESTAAGDWADWQ
jgi:signal transduction histidine kinase